MSVRHWLYCSSSTINEIKKSMKLIALLLSVCEGMLTLKEGYGNLQWNRRLEGRLLTITPRVSPLDCAEECTIRTGCLSFNYLRSAIFCELNYATDLIEDEVLTDSEGWIYGRREHWSIVSVFNNIWDKKYRQNYTSYISAFLWFLWILIYRKWF